MIGASMKTCPDCGGSGYAPEKTGEQPPYLYSSEPCPRCEGRGKTLMTDAQLDEQYPRHEEESNGNDG